MIRPILKYGDDVLHEQARPVDAITPDIDRLIDDMIETMYAAPGRRPGGAAGRRAAAHLRRRSLGRPRPGGLMVMINPEFVERDGMQLEEEGCLSVPGSTPPSCARPASSSRALDRTGTEHQREGTGLLARAFQHEMDHLDGTLFVDRLRGIKRDLIVRRIRKLTRAGKW